MEWITTRVNAAPTGPVEVTVELLDPTGDYLKAVGMSALNRLPMPIPNGPGNYMVQQGYVVQYDWAHVNDPKFFSGAVINHVRLTVKFVLVP